MKTVLLNKSVAVSIIVLGAVLLVLGITTFLNIGTWLIVSDPVPERIDVVFTFASESGRVAYSRELMSTFPEAHWVLSDYKDGNARVLRKEGFDMSRVTAIDTCSSTLGEVEALDAWLRGRTVAIVPARTDNSVSSLQRNSALRPLSVALVSSPYHMRRIRLMVNSTFHDRDLQFHYLPVPLERYRWSRAMFRNWWRSRSISGIVISELQKIVYFWLIS